MSAPKGTCQATITIAVTNPTLGTNALRYLIGATPIAGQTFGPAISIGAGLTTIGQIQALIDADLTYLASGTTITVTGFVNNALTVVITKTSSSQITDLAIGIFSDVTPVQSAFTCNLNKKSVGGGIVLPPYIFLPKRLQWFCGEAYYNGVNGWCVSCSNGLTNFTVCSTDSNSVKEKAKVRLDTLKTYYKFKGVNYIYDGYENNLDRYRRLDVKARQRRNLLGLGGFTVGK